jgi:hypothetical protein
MAMATTSVPRHRLSFFMAPPFESAQAPVPVSHANGRDHCKPNPWTWGAWVVPKGQIERLILAFAQKAFLLRRANFLLSRANCTCRQNRLTAVGGFVRHRQPLYVDRELAGPRANLYRDDGAAKGKPSAKRANCREMRGQDSLSKRWPRTVAGRRKEHTPRLVVGAVSAM